MSPSNLKKHKPKEPKELDPAKGFGSISDGPCTGGITSRILPVTWGVTSIALPATLGVTSPPLLRGASSLATTPVDRITSSKDRIANSSGPAEPWEVGPELESGAIKQSEADPKTPTKQDDTSAQPFDCTRLNSKSVEELHPGESLPEPARLKPATPPRDENTKPAPPTEQAYIDPECVAIKELKDAIVNELRLIQASTAESSWDFFYKNIGMVASLGSSITFALIVTDIEDPRSVSRHGWIDLSTVRIVLAISWIPFMVVLSLSFSFAQKLKRDSYGPMLSHLVYLLELTAVMCLAFVVAAYVEALTMLE